MDDNKNQTNNCFVEGGWVFFNNPKLTVFRSKAEDSMEMVSLNKLTVKLIAYEDGKTRLIGHGLKNKRVVLNGWIIGDARPALNKTDSKGVHMSFFNQATWEEDGSFMRHYIFKFKDDNEARKFCSMTTLASLAHKGLSTKEDNEDKALGVEESPSKDSEISESLDSDADDDFDNDAFAETQDCTAGGQALAAALMAGYKLEDEESK